MNNFYEAFERERSSDIQHHGVKGMRWGVTNEKEPVGERTAANTENDTYRINEEDRKYAVAKAKKVRTSPIDKIVSTVFLVGGLAGSIAGVLGLVQMLGGHPENIPPKVNYAFQKMKNRKYGNYYKSGNTYTRY